MAREIVIARIGRDEWTKFDKFAWMGLQKEIRIRRKMKLNFSSGGKYLYAFFENKKPVADIFWRSQEVIIRPSRSHDLLGRQHIERGKQFFNNLKEAYKTYLKYKEKGIRTDTKVRWLIDAKLIDIDKFVNK